VPPQVQPEQTLYYDETDDPGDADDLMDAAVEQENTRPPTPPKTKRKMRISDILILIVAVALMAGGGFFAFQALHQSSSEVTFPDMSGNRVVPDDPSAGDPSFLAQADAVPDTGTRFIIDSVSLDVPLGEVNEVNGVMNPPGFQSAYRVRNRGVTLDNADKGTVYIVAHALQAPGKAPGNYVTDTKTGTVTVQPGDVIKVGDRTYKMVSSEVIAKTALGQDAALWANTPGMLVFVTCMETSIDSSGHAVNNAVIVGQLIS